MKSRHIEQTANYTLTWDCSSAEISVLVKLEWNFDDDVPTGDQALVKQRFTSACLRKWNSHGFHFEAQRAYDGVARADALRRRANHVDQDWDMRLDGHGLPPQIKFQFSIIETTAGEHWDVELSKFSERSNVDPLLSNINVGLNDSDWVFQHEFGHALGLPDEYDECVHGSKTRIVCNIANLKRATERFSDRGGLMAIGDGLRTRYFHDIRDRLNRWTFYRYMFQVRPLSGFDSLGDDAPTPPGGYGRSRANRS